MIRRSGYYDEIWRRIRIREYCYVMDYNYKAEREKKERTSCLGDTDIFRLT